MEIKVKNNFFKVNIGLTIISILCFFVVAGCSNKNVAKEEEYKGAMLEKSNNIYLYYNKEEPYLEPIGDIEKLKEFSTLSPDGKNIAFKYKDLQNNINDRIEIYNMESRKYRTLSIQNEEKYNIIDIDWINNDRIIITLHLNPDESRYLVYDILEDSVVNSAEGLIIGNVDNGESIIYSKFDKIDNTTSIYIQDKEIYNFEDENEQFYIGGLSEDKKKIAFITSKYNVDMGNFDDYLYIGDFVKDNIENIKKIVKPYEILGDIVFDKDDKVYILSEDGSYTFDGKNFIEEEYRDNRKQPSENVVEKFNETLKQVFKSEISEGKDIIQQLGINSMIWF